MKTEKHCKIHAQSASPYCVECYKDDLAKEQADDRLARTTCSRMFRSACSGLWYQNPKAAGSIDAVELYGQRLIRAEDETSLAWIHRVAEWSAKLHSENA